MKNIFHTFLCLAVISFAIAPLSAKAKTSDTIFRTSGDTTATDNPTSYTSSDGLTTVPGGSADTGHQGSADTPTTGGGSGGGTVTLQNPLKATSIAGILETFVEVVSYLAILAAVFMLIWTGMQYVLARGNKTKLAEQSKRLGAILIGVALILAARVIVTIIINTLEATGTVNPQVINSAKSAL